MGQLIRNQLMCETRAPTQRATHQFMHASFTSFSTRYISIKEHSKSKKEIDIVIKQTIIIRTNCSSLSDKFPSGLMLLAKPRFAEFPLFCERDVQFRSSLGEWRQDVLTYTA
eukprot:6214678-Pleurochrysis_carterae.AAC.1